MISDPCFRITVKCIIQTIQTKAISVRCERYDTVHIASVITKLSSCKRFAPAWKRYLLRYAELFSIRAYQSIGNGVRCGKKTFPTHRIEIEINQPIIIDRECWGYEMWLWFSNSSSVSFCVRALSFPLSVSVPPFRFRSETTIPSTLSSVSLISNTHNAKLISNSMNATGVMVWCIHKILFACLSPSLSFRSFVCALFLGCHSFELVVTACAYPALEAKSYTHSETQILTTSQL